MLLFQFRKFFLSLFFGALIIFAAGSGCTVARIYATTGNDITVTEAEKVAGEAFTITKRVRFEYGGDLDVQELLRSRYGIGNRFQNVTVVIREDLTDMLFNYLTVGLANSRTYDVSGIKLPKLQAAPPK